MEEEKKKPTAEDLPSFSSVSLNSKNEDSVSQEKLSMKTASLKSPADEEDYTALIVPIGFAAVEKKKSAVVEEFDEEKENLKLRQQLKLRFDIS